MEIISHILSILCFVINSFAVVTIVIINIKWHTRMERKQEEMMRCIHRVANRNDIVYVAQLHQLKSQLIEAERYEEVKKIDFLIRQELERIETDNENRDAEH